MNEGETVLRPWDKKYPRFMYYCGMPLFFSLLTLFSFLEIACIGFSIGLIKGLWTFGREFMDGLRCVRKVIDDEIALFADVRSELREIISARNLENTEKAAGGAVGFLWRRFTRRI